ncbi:MAG: hypothetical protein A2653_02095 [Candidatus Zambryskibacteria bacterium RIFCSPHIGHO2_01_FULL_43_25]|nr:MAG: hypothetical protein A2653_02095 [Candidatus Zambryskibacteria bacterium RIFCSPHIGHO2_01_FULL_43_25]OHA99982.1 MAG: hypothetical protein A3E94_03140 [Candidatus Zambryskibacteria bacterium RIFCSPHIGHO2_12_FULL_44_12b]
MGLSRGFFLHPVILQLIHHVLQLLLQEGGPVLRRQLPNKLSAIRRTAQLQPRSHTRTVGRAIGLFKEAEAKLVPLVFVPVGPNEEPPLARGTKNQYTKEEFRLRHSVSPSKQRLMRRRKNVVNPELLYHFRQESPTPANSGKVISRLENKGDIINSDQILGNSTRWHQNWKRSTRTLQFVFRADSPSPVLLPRTAKAVFVFY